MDNINKEYELSNLIIRFCMDELIQIRKLMTDDKSYKYQQIELSKMCVQYLNTIENLCKMVEHDK